MQIEFHESEETKADDVGDDFTSLDPEPTTDLLRGAIFRSDGDAIRTVEQLRQFITGNIESLFERTLALCYQSAERAEEVVQELYPRMLRFLERNPEGLREPWAAVYCVARRLAVDDYRRTARGWHEPLPDDDFLSDNRVAAATDVDDVEQLERLIGEAMEMLDPRLAAIVRGVFFEGRRGREIAADLGLSESRVCELKSLALTQMRTHLEQTLYPSS